VPSSSAGHAYGWDCTPYLSRTTSCRINATPNVSRKLYSGSSRTNRATSSRSKTIPRRPSTTGTTSNASHHDSPTVSSSTNAPTAPSM
jgi:hypothetical protein